MNIWIEPTGRRIQPFDDPPGDTLIQNRPLRDWQAAMVRDAGLTVVDSLKAPCLVVPDTLWTTGEALRAFLEGAAGRDAVFVLKQSLFGRLSTPVQPQVSPVDGGWRFEAVRFHSGAGLEPVDVVVDPDEETKTLPIPGRYVGNGEVELSLARRPVMTLHHWVHILWANQFAGLLGLRTIPKWKAALSLLWAVIRSFSFNKWRVLSKLNRIGKGCDIHPTAVVEGSELGAGVSVGPFARILFSTVGDGATILGGASVEASTLGPKAMVCQQTVLRLCVLYPEAIAGQEVMQFCVLGRGVVTTLASYSIDLNFDQTIRVPLDGVMWDTGTHFLGSAFGHGARIGTGHWMSHGRMIPNGYFVVRDPRQVIARIPAGLADAGPLANDHGTLVPVSQLKADS